MSNGNLVITAPSGNPMAIRTTTDTSLATTIEPGKTYTFETGSGNFNGNTTLQIQPPPAPVTPITFNDSNSLYRFVLIDDTVGTGPVTTGFIRFGGSYMFSFNSDNTIEML
jgi:hypothetical protein